MHKRHFHVSAFAVLASVLWCTETVAFDRYYDRDYDRYYGGARVHYPHAPPVYSYTYSELRVYGAAPYSPAPPVARYYGEPTAAGYYGGPRVYDDFSFPRAQGYRYRYRRGGTCTHARYR